MRMPSLQRLDASPVGKMLLAVTIFCLITGGWMGYRRYQESIATLPSVRQQHGACTLWFVGSSSMHRWTSLGRDMAPWATHNRGIDDATYAQILPRFANAGDEVPPTAIILYAGENDIANGAPVRSVVHDLAAFLVLRDQMMPDVPVLVLSMKPSPGRWLIFPNQQLFNGAAQRLLPRMRMAYYTDVTTPLLKDGKLGDNYRADGVHMNPAGYRIWADIVRQRLAQILPEAARRRCDPGQNLPSPD